MSDLSPWRVEWLRLVRTRRLLALAGTFLFFGFSGPLTAYYLPELLRNGAASPGIKIILSTPVPADGIQGYSDNVLLFGVIVLVVVAASACAVDARPPLSVFYRTRARTFWQILFPRAAMAACAGIAAWLLGLSVAWYETTVLLGAPDPAAMGESAVLASIYIIFTVALAVIASAVMRSAVAAAGSAIALVFLTQIPSAVPQLTQWMPYGLSEAPDSLLFHTAAFHHYDRAVIVAVVATIGLMAAARSLGSRREVG